jgi:hypothetical protein
MVRALLSGFEVKHRWAQSVHGWATGAYNTMHLATNQVEPGVQSNSQDFVQFLSPCTQKSFFKRFKSSQKFHFFMKLCSFWLK